MKRVLVILIAVLLLAIFYRACIHRYIGVYEALNEPGLSKEDSIAMNKTALEEYTSIFPDPVRDELKMKHISLSTIREPFALMEYKKNTDLMVYKVQVEKSIKEIFTDTEGDERQSIDMAYRIYYQHFRDIEIAFSQENPKLTNKINITYSGSNVSKIMQGDSILSYTLKLKSFTISYEPDGIKQIAMESPNDKMPKMNICFYKKGSTLYYIFLYYPWKPESMPDHAALRLLAVEY